MLNVCSCEDCFSSTGRFSNGHSGSERICYCNPIRREPPSRLIWQGDSYWKAKADRFERLMPREIPAMMNAMERLLHKPSAPNGVHENFESLEEEKMPKNSRREIANGITPLISFDEVAAEKESFKLSWTVLANIREYVAYVRDVTGRDTTSDEVVDKALQRLFDADKGFRHWLHKKNGANRNRVKPGRTEKAEKPALDGRANASVETFPKP